MRSVFTSAAMAFTGASKLLKPAAAIPVVFNISLRFMGPLFRSLCLRSLRLAGVTLDPLIGCDRILPEVFLRGGPALGTHILANDRQGLLVTYPVTGTVRPIAPK